MGASLWHICEDIGRISRINQRGQYSLVGAEGLRGLTYYDFGPSGGGFPIVFYSTSVMMPMINNRKVS